MSTAERKQQEADMIDDGLEEHAEALARHRWAEEDYSIDDVGMWDEMTGHYPIGEITPGTAIGGANGSVFYAEFHEEDFEEIKTSVVYSSSGVQLDLNATGDDAHVGTAVELTPAQAVEVATMLCQAAIELDRR